MSLINQMLQDLEQRGTGESRGDGMRALVRAVPEREGVHAAWWLVLLLSLMLAGMGGWLWLRAAPQNPVAKAPPPVAGTVKMAAPAPRPEPAPLQPVAPQASAQVPAQEAAVVPLPAMQPLPLAPAAPPASAAPVKPVASAAPAPAPPSAMRQNPPHAAATGVAASGIGPNDAKNVPAAAKKDVRQAASPPALLGKDDGTSSLANQIKELTPQQRAENAYRAAALALQQGQQAEALADLQQALQFNAQHAGARQMLVGLLLQTKRTDEAVRTAQDGLNADPSQFGLAMILARVQVEQTQQGGLQAAIETLNRSLPYAADRPDYQAFLAALLQRDNRHKEAIEHYVAALGKTPQNGVWWMGLGISLQAENHLDEAREAFSRAKASNVLTPELASFVDQKLRQLK